MLKKLRMKFVCINMTILTIMLIIIMCTVVHFTKINLEQTSISMMQELAANPFYPMKPTDNQHVRLPYFSLRLNHRGDLLETGGNFYDLSDNDSLSEMIGAVLSSSDNIGILPDYNLRFMRITTPPEQFVIFIDISNELSIIENLTRNCILIGIGGFFLFLGMSIFLARWAVKPVAKAWEQQKQFIADASHELKTPLTAILTNAELLGSPDYNDENKARFSDNILIMAKQMRHLVEGLLDLSRIDNGTMKTAMKKVDFSMLTQNAVFPFEPLYFENNLILDSNISDKIWVNGSEMHLKQVIEILLDNALKYAFSGTQVQITLQKQNLYCLLSVCSQGETIPSEELSNIFRRFYRTEKSRHGSGSYGLGLSIAESIVLEHNGKIWAESKNCTNTFYVRLPAL